MCKLLDGPPRMELRKGIVHITDEDGHERGMLLGDFVIATKQANKLARQWVAEANVVEMEGH